MHARDLDDRRTSPANAPGIVPARFPSPLAVAAIISFLSGAAGLAHQVLWTRRLVDVLGATSLTFSKVIGAFFLGLALGGWLAARYQPRRNPWLAVAIAELITAAMVLPVLWLPHWFTPSSSALTEVFKFALPLLIVTPPAVVMGAVIPWLVRVFSADTAPRHSIIIYSINIIGGIAGIISLLLLMLPRLGTVGSGLLAAALNLAAALIAATYGFRSREISDSAIHSSTPKIPFQIKVAAFVSGFVVLAAETLLQHQFAQVTINSFFSNGSVLAFVLFGLGLSALLLPVFLRFVPANRQLTVAFAASTVCLLLQPLAFHSMRPGLEILAYELKPLPYTIEIAKLGLVTIVPLFLALGLVFPLIFRNALQQYGARSLGLLLAWNGVGGWLGAELTQYYIAPSFGLWAGIVYLGSLYLIATSLTASRSRVRLFIFTAGFTIIAGCILAYRSFPQVSQPPGERLVELRITPDGVVAAVESKPGDWRIVFNNSYTLGGSTAQFNQERQAHLPLLLHGPAKSVALLGIATGSTMAGAAAHPDLATIDAFELSPAVLDYARKHFAPYNRGVFNDPRVRAHAQDARWGISTAGKNYDVILGDLFLPWRTGEGRLFTRDHFQNVKSALSTNGLFCQWLPMFQLTRPQFESIARTFREVFPEAFIIRGDFYAELPILGLVGGRSLQSINWESVERAAQKLRSVTVAPHQVRDALALYQEAVAMMVIGQLPHFTNAPVNTLDNGWLEWNAGQNVLGLREPWFVGVPLAEFIRDLQRENNSQLPSHLREAHTIGQFFLTLEVATHVDPSIAQNLKAQIPQRMPASMRTNSVIDWSQWPSRIKPFQP